MGKRYFCDYCDRSFVDEIQARKKHLNGTAHVRNRQIHYMSCRDLKTLIEEETVKEECFKFKRTGQCPFEENCYRSHYSREQLQSFKQQLAEQELQKKLRDLSEIKSIDSWLDKRNTVDIGTGQDPDDSHTTPYVPLESNFYNSLPPSLRRLDFTTFVDLEIPEWG
ncbi:zinc finger matrin-type protein 5-like [Planococcus citri]|uniref:zinc finger matrin-type protein 5-like n=1 Tax=Planococcus citri TaxID=170843 RepID=UPI0031F96070